MDGPRWIIILIFVNCLNTVGRAANCPKFTEADFPGLRIRYKRQDTKVQFRCRKKFERYGPKFAICRSDGTWSSKPPLCTKTGCVPLDPNQVQNLHMEVVNGAVVKFTCLNNYLLIGDTQAHCNGKVWSAPLPRCAISLQPKVVYKPTEYPYSRCFEHGTNRVTCEKLNFSKERQEKQSVWPPGPYALRPTIYGCPESESRGWFKSNVLISDEVISFCVKFRNDSTLDQGQWIPGTYSIFKAGPSCPTGFEESSINYSGEFMLAGQVPNIVVTKIGRHKQLINISTCKRRSFTDMGNIRTSVTFRMLETDFHVNPVMNCPKFDVSTVSVLRGFGGNTCFYSPKVVNIDYELATELIPNHYEQYLKKYEDKYYTWYFLDCQRILEVVMIELNTSSTFDCFVSDALQLDFMSMLRCNIHSIEKHRISVKIYLRRTHGRFFRFLFNQAIYGVVSFKIFISSIDAQNGEPCFESIHIQETQASGNYFKTELSAVDEILRSLITFLFKDLADLTPWILVCLIHSKALFAYLIELKTLKMYS